MRVLVAVVVLLLLCAPQAQAHAKLERTVPADGARLQAGPESVAFHFGEVIEANFGAVRVYDAAGSEVETGSTFRPDGDDHALAIALQPNLPDGTYTATFRIISADSHPVAGAISFTVGDPAAGGAVVKRAVLPPQVTTGKVTSAAFWADRWLGYLALAVALGVPFFAASIWWRTLAEEAGGGAEWLRASAAFDQRIRLLAGGAVLTGVVASVLALPLEAASAGGTTFWGALNASALDEVRDTRFGSLITLRILAWMLLGVLLLAVGARGRMVAMRPVELGAMGLAPQRRIKPELAALLMLPAGSLLVSPALAGHARTQSNAWLLLPADAIHVSAMCLWFGGLAALAVAVPFALGPLGANDRARVLLGALARFSPLALASVIALAVTGTLQAIVEVGSVPALVETGYGRAVVAKVLLLTVLIGLGAANRQRLLPALERAVAAGVEPGRVTGWLRRNLRTEVALIAGVLAVTAVLVAYAPASETGGYVAGQPAPLSLAGAPSAGRVMVGPVLLRYTVDPGRVGANQINLFVRNPDGGVSKRAKEVQVALSLPSHGIAALKPTVEDLGAGHYVASGAQLNLPGTWKVAVTVRTSEFDEATGEFEVPIG
jgi:copper transport protein